MKVEKNLSKTEKLDRKNIEIIIKCIEYEIQETNAYIDLLSKHINYLQGEKNRLMAKKSFWFLNKKADLKIRMIDEKIYELYIKVAKEVSYLKDILQPIK